MAVYLSTSYGNMTLELYVDECPLACTNFLKLCKLGYFNNCLFHSIIKDFIVQTGDPTGTGSGGDSLLTLLHHHQQTQQEDDKELNKFFVDELHPSLKHDCRGKVAMASVGPNLNASQFYITLRETPIDFLDGRHTVFGEITEDYDHVLEQINDTLVDLHSFRPLRNIGIKQVYILHDPFEDPLGLAQILSKGLPMPTQPLIDDKAIEDAHTIHGNGDGDEANNIRRREAHSRAVVLEMIGDIPEAEIKPPENMLFVCKLNPDTEEEDLDIIFSQFGVVLSVDIVTDKKTGKSLCYGFVEFETKEACEAAYFKMDNARIDDKMWARYRAQCSRENSSDSHVKSEILASNRRQKLNSSHHCKRSRHLSQHGS